jgi:hypothetical protein
LHFAWDALPWCNDNNETEIIQKKIDVSNNQTYPAILLEFLKYTRSLEYEETPKYYFIIEKFRREIELLSKTN